MGNAWINLTDNLDGIVLDELGIILYKNSILMDMLQNTLSFLQVSFGERRKISVEVADALQKISMLGKRVDEVSDFNWQGR